MLGGLRMGPGVQAWALLLLLLSPADAYNLDVKYPIVYELSSGNRTRSNYFGMSVALRPSTAQTVGSWVVQVGAPRDTVEGVGEPGAVYRCPLYGPCDAVVLDEHLNGAGGRGVHAYRGKATEAWIGASMDVQYVDGRERSVVCGHRWMNENLANSENIDVTYLMTGICYLQDIRNGTYETFKLLPLVNSDRIYTPKPYVVNLSTYHWGLGQIGTSVRLTEDPGGLVIGAPGLTHWIGSVVRYEEDFTMVVGNFMRTDIYKKNRYTYLGYSVTTGRFYRDKQIWFVAGAPRSANYRGEVVLFRYKDSRGMVYVQTTLRGQGFGEYFGYSLATDDINADGYDDLVVGAPTFSGRYPDEGRIYVYLGNGRENFMREAQVVDGHVGRGRFGSCVASLKDLDGDGYNDVVVGSPYEDESRGAVYVYRGFSMGLLTRPAQRVRARDFGLGLRGFGASLGAGVDVDGNGHVDVVVGAYLSDHVVLLRSRPVITVQTMLKKDLDFLLDRQASSFNFTVCSGYSGSNSPPFADVLTMMDVDSLYGRATLRGATTKQIRLKVNEVTCKTYTADLNVSDKNYAPLTVRLKSWLPDCSRSDPVQPIIVGQSSGDDAHDGFAKWCPMGSQSEETAEIQFAGVCGPDGVCVSDVRATCDIPEFAPNAVYVLGSSEYFHVVVNLTNVAEPAYNVKLKISSNLNLRASWRNEYESSGPTTDDTSRKVFWYAVRDLFTGQFQGNFSFRFEFDKMAESGVVDNRNLALTVDVHADNSDVGRARPGCRFLARLSSDAAVTLLSSTPHPSFFLPDKGTGEWVNVTHYYEIQKTGWTPLSDVKIGVSVPTHFAGSQVLYDIETSDWVHVTNRDKVLSFADFGTEGSSRNSSFETGGRHVFKLSVPGGIPREPSTYIKIVASLRVATSDSSETPFEPSLTTATTLRYKTPLHIAYDIVRGNVSSHLVAREPAKAVEGYVLALSVLLGGVILLLIVSWLAKLDFFKRTKKEELKASKESDPDAFVYFSQSVVPDEGCGSG